MIGSAAERMLLGALIEAPQRYYQIESLVNGDDFADGRLEQVFNEIVMMIVRGETVEPVGVSNAVRNAGLILPEGFIFEITGADVLPHAIAQYANAVKADGTKRHTKDMIATAHRMMEDGKDPLIVASRLEEMARNVVNGSTTSSLKAESLHTILAQEEVYDWVVPGLLETHDRLIVTAPEGAGKTTFMRQLVVLSAAGIHPITFDPIEPQTALVIDAENTERQWRRTTNWVANRASVAGHRDPRHYVSIVAGKRIDITSGPHLGEIHRLIDKVKPSIVYMGPLYKLVPKAIMTDDDAAPLITALDSIRERDVALVMEAHAGHAQHAGGHRDLRPRGSSALLGWPEFGFGLRPLDDFPDVVQITRWRGDRETRDWPSHLVRGKSWPWEPAVSPE